MKTSQSTLALLSVVLLSSGGVLASTNDAAQICQSKCLRANVKSYGWATPPNDPPCWKQEADGYYSCFDYIDGKCPWEGMTDCHAKAPTTTKAPVQPTTVPTAHSTTTPPVVVTTKPPADQICHSKCLRGNYPGGGWAYAPNTPPCWVQQDTYFSCYDYVNGKCPWEGMTDCGSSHVTTSSAPTTATPTTTTAAVTSVPVATTKPAVVTTAPPSGEVCTSKCLRGNYPGGGWAYPPHAAPCWMQQDGYFSCYEYVNGKCEWPGMTDCGRSGKKQALRG